MKILKSVMVWVTVLVLGFIGALIVSFGATSYVYFKIYTLDGWTIQGFLYFVLAFCCVLLPALLKISEWLLEFRDSILTRKLEDKNILDIKFFKKE